MIMLKQNTGIVSAYNKQHMYCILLEVEASLIFIITGWRYYYNYNKNYNLNFSF